MHKKGFDLVYTLKGRSEDLGACFSDRLEIVKDRKVLSELEEVTSMPSLLFFLYSDTY